MIIFLRNMMHKRNFYKVFLWIFLLMFIGGGIGLINVGKKTTAIQVYKQDISRERYFNALQAAQKQQEYYRSQGVRFEGKNIKRDVLEQLINRSLEEKIMQQLNLQADEFNIQKTLHDQLRYLPDSFFDAKGNLDEQMFKRHVSMDVEGLLDDIRYSAEKEVLNGIIDASQYTAQFELNAQYNKEYADKVIEILNVAPSNYTKQVEDKGVTDKQLEAFYKTVKNTDRFKTQEKRAGQYWIFDKGAYHVTVSDKEIKKVYDARKKDEYLVSPAEVQVRQIYFKATTEDSSVVKERLKALRAELVDAPDTFTSVAKKVSEDKETASKGGLLPFFTKDSRDYDVVLVKAAFETLTKDGQISQVIKVKDGYALLQRVSRKKTKYQPLKSVQSKIEKELLTAKFQKRFMQAAKRMISQVKYKPEGLEAFVKKHSGTQKFLTLATRAGSLTSVKLFQTNEDKYNAFFDEKGNGIILHCSQVEKSVSKPLADVRKEVEDLYFRAEGEKLMDADMRQAVQDSSTMSFKEIAEKYGFKYDRGESTYQNGRREETSALKIYGIQQKIPFLQYPGDVVSVEMAHGNALLRLESLAERNQELFDAQKRDMQQTLYYAEKYKKRESFIASLGRNAIINNKIVITDEFKA